jgi:hypothetical protein
MLWSQRKNVTEVVDVAELRNSFAVTFYKNKNARILMRISIFAKLFFLMPPFFSLFSKCDAFRKSMDLLEFFTFFYILKRG